MDKFVVHEAGPSFPSSKKQLLSRYFVELFTHAGEGGRQGLIRLKEHYPHFTNMIFSGSCCNRTPRQVGSFPQSNLSHFFPPEHAPVWQRSVVDTLSSHSEIAGMASGNAIFASSVASRKSEYMYRLAQSEVELSGAKIKAEGSDMRSSLVDIEVLSDSNMWLGVDRPIVTCVEFDSQGVYVASVSSNGCLSIHDYETLYCTAGATDVTRPTVHIQTQKNLEAVRWNPQNQEEVAVVASGSSNVYLYDIASLSYVPRQMLHFKTSLQRGQPAGLLDVSYCALNKDRLVACGNDNNVHIWDRRSGKVPSVSLPAPSGGGDLNCLQLSTDEQLVFAGSERGHIFLWDLRGGRLSAAFVTPGEDYHPPLRAVKVAKLLEDIPDLKAQTTIENSSVHSISLSPSCGHHLGFHLNNGWSGVLDLMTFAVTHMHCPPPPWTEQESAPWLNIRRRRAAWLTSYPVYAVGCTMECHINILDFTPGPCSRHKTEASVEEKLRKQLQSSEPVVAIAVHPSNDCLVAGTEAGSLLLIAQRKMSANSEMIV